MSSEDNPETAEPPPAEPPPTVSRTKSRPQAADAISLPRTMSEEWMAADVDDGAYEEDTRRPVWLIPAIVGAVLTIAVITLFALHGGDSAENRQGKPIAAAPLDPPAPAVTPPAPVAGDAAVAAVAPADAPEPIDAAAIVAAPPDAPVVAAAPPPPVDAARIATAPVDAAPVVHVDAAVRVASVPADAKPVAAKPPNPLPSPKDERTIEQLVGAGEFAKANTACADNTKFSTPRLEACAIAACQTHSTALAQRWVRAIDRSAAGPILDKCKALGVELAAP